MPFDATPLNLSPVKLALIEGRAAIERGWCQGKCLNETGEVCMTGAPESRDPGGTLPTAVYDRAFRLLAIAALGEPNLSIVPWNDEPGRTKAEVLAVFDAAIARADA